VDFKNFSYGWSTSVNEGVSSAWDWLKVDARTDLQLIGGMHSFAESGAYLELASVTYGDIDGDGFDEAAVDLLYSTGTANRHYLYVYAMPTDQAPTLLGVLKSGSRAQGGLVASEIKEGSLILSFNDEERAEGDCCSRGIIRVFYRFQNGSFVEVGAREKDSLRFTTYPLLPKTGPRTVRDALNGRTVNVVYTDSHGTDRNLTSSGVNTQPNLSPDKRLVVFLKKVKGQNKEIWTVRTDGSGAQLVFGGPVRWKDRWCPSSTYRSPQWSIDGRAIFFVTDCTSMTGALWRLEIGSRKVRSLIPEAVLYGVIQSGLYRGYLIANQRTLPTSASPARYPVYNFFLYAPDGARIKQIGDESDDIDELLAS
jgi:hypothetical protein